MDTGLVLLEPSNTLDTFESKPFSEDGHSESSQSIFDNEPDISSMLPTLSGDLDFFAVLEESLPDVTANDDAIPNVDFDALVAELLPSDSTTIENDEISNLNLSAGSDQECSSESNSQPGSLEHTRRPQPAKRTRDVPEASESSSIKTKAQVQEERLQKRLAKNRRTAAESRERKKRAMKDLNDEVLSLKDENTRLKHELEVQKMHTQLLREELASFTRSAKKEAADAATEPAALISTTTLPSVHDNKVMKAQRLAAPSSPNSQLVTIWSVLACLYLTSQTAGSVIETLSNFTAAEPEAASKLIKAFSGADAEFLSDLSINSASRRIGPIDVQGHLRGNPWQSHSPLKLEAAA